MPDIRVKLADNVNLAAWNVVKQIAIEKGESRADLGGWIAKLVERECEHYAKTDPLVRAALNKE